MEDIPIIKLYGAAGCHKTIFYKSLLDETGLPYIFLDVEANTDYAKELRALYENRKLNFPTITIGKKKLRNPSEEELQTWLNKLIPDRLPIIHDKENHRFTMDINGALGVVTYDLRDGKMYLIHSEIPYNLRGLGIGKVLVIKTFEQLKSEGYEAVAVCSWVKAIAKRSKKWREVIN